MGLIGGPADVARLAKPQATRTTVSDGTSERTACFVTAGTTVTGGRDFHRTTSDRRGRL